MNEQLFEVLDPREGIKYHRIDGNVWLAAEEIGIQLGYAEPRVSVMNIYMRNQAELEPFSTVINLNAADGKLREMRIFNEEGVYIITMLARTEKASVFRQRVARLIHAVREQSLELARIAGAEQVRKSLVEGLKKVGPERLAVINKAVYYRSLGLTFKEVGKLLDCGKDAARWAYRDGQRLGLAGQAVGNEDPEVSNG